MKDKIQLDIGVGDLVEAVEETFDPFKYNGKPIFEGEISLMVYPVESIFAEKLETIVSKGVTNSRMKDYHDVILMLREKDMLEGEKVKKTIVATFKNRGTKWPGTIKFDGPEMKTRQGYWVAHLNGLGAFKSKLDLPEQLSSVISEINSWIERNLKLSTK